MSARLMMLAGGKKESHPEWNPLTQYDMAIRDSEPVAYWSLQDTAGSVAFESVRGWHGTYEGGYSLQTGTSPNGWNLYTHFADGCVMVPNLNNRLQPTPQYTLELWFYRTLPWRQYDSLFGFNSNDWDVRLDAASSTGATPLRAHWYFDTGATDQSAFIAGTLPKSVLGGSWHHLVLRWDGVNGAKSAMLDGTVTLAGPMSVGSPRNLSTRSTLTLGGAGGARRWRGAMGRIAVYNRILPDSEVRSHRSAGIPRP